MLIKDKTVPVTFVRAGQQDIPAIRSFLVYMWKATYGAFLSARAIEKVTASWHSTALLSFQMEDPDFYFGVLKDAGNNIIGVITVKKAGEGVLSIDRLYIHPEYQVEGLGTRLLGYSLGVFPGTRKLRVEVFKDNGAGLDFYTRQGFALTGTKREKIEDVSLDAVVMEKELGLDA